MLEKIKEILADQLDLSVNTMIDEWDTLADIGTGNANFDIAMIAMWIEDEFDIELDVEEISADMTVTELAAAIEKKVQP